MAIIAKYSVIPCSEVFSQRRESIDSKGRWKVNTILQCKWSDRWKLIADLYTSGYKANLTHKGDIVAAGGNINQVLYPYLPRAFPDPPFEFAGQLNGTRIGFTHASIVPDPTKYTSDNSFQVIEPEYANIGVEYSTYYDVEETIEWQVEYLRVNYRNFQWKNEAFTGDTRQLKEGEAQGFAIYSAILTREIRGLDKYWVQNLYKVIGNTNKSPYRSEQLETTFAEETLLMLNPRIKPAMNLINLPAIGNAPEPFSSGFDVTLRFLVKGAAGPNAATPITHNKFWRPNIQVDETGNPGDPSTAIYGGDWDEMEVKVGEDQVLPYRPHPRVSELSGDKNLWLKKQRQPEPLAS